MIGEGIFEYGAIVGFFDLFTADVAKVNLLKQFITNHMIVITDLTINILLMVVLTVLQVANENIEYWQCIKSYFIDRLK